MKKIVRYYVKYWSPGSFVGESWTKDIQNPDPLSIEWPDNAYAFSLHRQEDVIDGDSTYSGKPEQIGPLYYHPESKIETLEEVKKNRASSKILIDNMEINKWNKIIWSRWNNWPQPYEPEKMEVIPS